MSPPDASADVAPARPASPSTATSGAAPSQPLPPHLQQLLGPLASSRSILGLLVLARSKADPGAAPTVVQAQGPAFEGDVGKAYALRVAVMVQAVEDGCLGKDGSGDPLKFLRIRTAKHELIITPDPNYILVVLHDPAQ